METALPETRSSIVTPRADRNSFIKSRVSNLYAKSGLPHCFESDEPEWRLPVSVPDPKSSSFYLLSRWKMKKEASHAPILFTYPA